MMLSPFAIFRSNARPPSAGRFRLANSCNSGFVAGLQTLDHLLRQDDASELPNLRTLSSIMLDPLL